MCEHRNWELTKQLLLPSHTLWVYHGCQPALLSPMAEAFCAWHPALIERTEECVNPSRKVSCHSTMKEKEGRGPKARSSQEALGISSLRLIWRAEVDVEKGFSPSELRWVPSLLECWSLPPSRLCSSCLVAGDLEPHKPPGFAGLIHIWSLWNSNGRPELSSLLLCCFHRSCPPARASALSKWALTQILLMSPQRCRFSCFCVLLRGGYEGADIMVWRTAWRHQGPIRHGHEHVAVSRPWKYLISSVTPHRPATDTAQGSQPRILMCTIGAETKDKLRLHGLPKLRGILIEMRQLPHTSNMSLSCHIFHTDWSNTMPRADDGDMGAADLECTPWSCIPCCLEKREKHWQNHATCWKRYKHHVCLQIWLALQNDRAPVYHEECGRRFTPRLHCCQSGK